MDKTFADVADKALDKLSGGLEAIAAGVQKVAPQVWEVFVRQVMAEGAVTLAACITAILFTVWLFKKCWKLSEDVDDYADFRTIIRFFLVISVGIIGLVCFINSQNAALMLINPRYYAAERLIKIATGKDIAAKAE